MNSIANTVPFLSDLPYKANEGDIFYVDESKKYFTKPVYYIWKCGAWQIEYITQLTRSSNEEKGKYVQSTF